MELVEPSWTFALGPVDHKGTGLLHPPLWQMPDADTFSVSLNGTQLICQPRRGVISRNLVPVLQVAPGKLLWFRRMQIVLSANGGGRQHHCRYYALGIENRSGRFGCRLYADGRVEQGLEA